MGVKVKGVFSFVIKPVKQSDSPLNVEGVDLSLSADEIVGILREVRKRNNNSTNR